MKRLILILAAALGISAAQAQSLGNLPSGYIGYVGNPTANQTVLYTFNFTATTTGSDYVGFAFRQDPAFWSFTNPSVTAAGSTTNLLTNASLAQGGPVQVTTNNGTQTIQAPANWGVWYQNGTYPAAAGTWSTGQWYDGAVGTYDGIYQGITVTTGVTYTISFDALSTYQASTLQQAIIGVYAGPCTNTSLAASLCVPTSSAGFTPIAQPNQTVNAGNPSAPPVSPSAPTVVSTAPGTPIVTTSQTLGTTVNTSATTYGTPTNTSSSVNGTPSTQVIVTDARGAQTPQNLTVVQTTTTNTFTPVQTTTVTTTPYTTTVTHTTPVTVTTVTTPTTVTTYSDGTTTTTNGTPVTTTAAGTPIVTQTVTTGNQVATTVTNTVTETTAAQNQNFTTRVDMMTQLGTVNSQINSAVTSDPLSRTRINRGVLSLRNEKESDVYLIGDGLRTNTVNGYQTNTGIVGVGADHIIDPSLLLGVQFNHATASMSSDGTAGGSLTKEMFGVYGIKSINDYLIKFDAGVAFNNYSEYHTLPALNLGNSGSATGHDYYGSVRLYTPDLLSTHPSLEGLRGFVGQGYERDTLNGLNENGSTLTAVTYDPVNTQTWTTEAGVGYYQKLTKNWSIGGELSRNNRDQYTELVSLSYKTTDNSSVMLKAGSQQTGAGVNNAVQAWARINF